MTLKKQLITFLMVGCLNTLVGYILYSSFIFAGLDYPLAMLFSMCFSALFNFKTTGTFVFKNKNNQGLSKFIGAVVFMYFFNTGAIRLIKLFTSNLYLAGLLAIVPAAIISFLLNKYLVFRKPLAVN